MSDKKKCVSQLYARVFLQILDSSIAEDFTTRHVFEDFLKLSEDGIVDMTRQALSRRINCPMETLNEAIAKLEAEDPNSRDREFEGRRIEKLDEHRDWGWRILNWEKYDEMRTRADVAIRVARHRKKKTGDGSAGESETGKPSVEAQWPSEQEVVDRAAIIGLAEWKARDWFAEMEGCAWIDYSHRPIRKWQNVLNRVRTKWEADGRPMGPPKKADKPLSVMDMSAVLKAKQVEADALKVKFCSQVAMGDQWNDDEAKRKFFALKKEIKELNSKIGKMA